MSDQSSICHVAVTIDDVTEIIRKLAYQILRVTP